MATGVDIGKIQKLFDTRAIAQELKDTEPVRSFFKDNFFTDRKNHPFSYVGTQIMNKILQSMAMVLPGGMPEGMRKKTVKNVRISPDPIAGVMEFEAEEVLQILEAGGETLEQWRAEVIQDAKNNVAYTTENMMRKSVTGKLEWKARTESGNYEDMELYDFSSLVELVASLGFTTATKLSQIIQKLDDLYEKLEDKGVMADFVNVLCGKTMFYAVLDLVNSKQKNDVLGAVYDTAKGLIDLGKYKLWNEAGKYRDGGTNQTEGQAVAATEIQMIAGNNNKLRYLKQGNFTAGFNSAPFILVPEITQGGNKLKFWIYSKPVPLFDVIRTIKGKDGA